MTAKKIETLVHSIPGVLKDSPVNTTEPSAASKVGRAIKFVPGLWGHNSTIEKARFFKNLKVIFNNSFFICLVEANFVLDFEERRTVDGARNVTW